MAYKISVIGGINLDIGGRPSESLRLRDSNIGTISRSAGGVGFNIAKNLAEKGTTVSLVSALGDDSDGGTLMLAARAAGIDITDTLVTGSLPTSRYLYVTDENGDMYTAVNDMRVTELITPEYLRDKMSEINRSDALVADANLRRDTLEYIAERAKIPIYADSVSVAKCLKLKGLALRAIKPNMAEAEKLTGRDTPEEAAKALLESGIGRVFISLGTDGMYAAEVGNSCRVPCPEVVSGNTNGAGDAAMAAIILADLDGKDLEETARAAVEAAAQTVALQ